MWPTLGPQVLLFPFSRISRSRANLSLRFQADLAVSSSPSCGVYGLFRGSSSMSLGSSRIISGLTFSLTVTANRNCSNQILNCHGGSKFAIAQHTGIPISVRLSWAENPAGCAMWYPTRYLLGKLNDNSKKIIFDFE